MGSLNLVAVHYNHNGIEILKERTFGTSRTAACPDKLGPLLGGNACQEFCEESGELGGWRSVVLEPAVNQSAKLRGPGDLG